MKTNADKVEVYEKWAEIAGLTALGASIFLALTGAVGIVQLFSRGFYYFNLYTTVVMPVVIVVVGVIVLLLAIQRAYTKKAIFLLELKDSQDEQ